MIIEKRNLSNGTGGYVCISEKGRKVEKEVVRKCEREGQQVRTE